MYRAYVCYKTILLDAKQKHSINRSWYKSIYAAKYNNKYINYDEL